MGVGAVQALLPFLIFSVVLTLLKCSSFQDFTIPSDGFSIANVSTVQGCFTSRKKNLQSSELLNGLVWFQCVESPEQPVRFWLCLNNTD